MSDDITFCPSLDCELKSCMRNQSNIKQHQYPHSFSVEIPEDCPKIIMDVVDNWLQLGAPVDVSAEEIEKAFLTYQKHEGD